MGLSILSEIAIQADHRVLTAREGFAPIDKTEVALVASPEASPATLRLADRLAGVCPTGPAEAGESSFPSPRSCGEVKSATAQSITPRRGDGMQPVVAEQVRHELQRPENLLEGAVADAQAPRIGAERRHHCALAIAGKAAPLHAPPAGRNAR